LHFLNNCEAAAAADNPAVMRQYVWSASAEVCSLWVLSSAVLYCSFNSGAVQYQWRNHGWKVEGDQGLGSAPRPV